MPYNKNLLTWLARGRTEEYWPSVVVALGPYCHEPGPIFPSTALALGDLFFANNKYMPVDCLFFLQAGTVLSSYFSSFSRPYSCRLLLVLHSHLGFYIHCESSSFLHRKERWGSYWQSRGHRQVFLPGWSPRFVQYPRLLPVEHILLAPKDLVENGESEKCRGRCPMGEGEG